MMSGQTLEQVYGGTPVVHYPNEHAGSGGVTPAVHSFAPYLGRGNFCMAKGDTCQARKVAESDYCAGHKRQFEKTGERP